MSIIRGGAQVEVQQETYSAGGAMAELLLLFLHELMMLQDPELRLGRLSLSLG